MDYQPPVNEHRKPYHCKCQTHPLFQSYVSCWHHTGYDKLFFKVLRHKTINTCNSAIDNKFIDHLQTDIVNGRKMWEYCGDMWVFGYLH